MVAGLVVAGKEVAEVAAMVAGVMVAGKAPLWYWRRGQLI
jgi:hypothetical protein